MTIIPYSDRFDAILNAAAASGIAVVGDFCLDAYWFIADASEPSLETGLPVRKVGRQRYSLGGAGNVAANLAALGVGRVAAVGVVGDDLFAYQIRLLLDRLGIDASSVLAGGEDWQTLVYGKPIGPAGEEPRLDFGAANQWTPTMAEQLLSHLDGAAERCNVVIINQQITRFPTELIEQINAVVRKHPRVRFIVDARQDPHLYERCILKLNVQEARRFLSSKSKDFARCDCSGELARRIHDLTGHPVFLTRGEAGLVVADDSGIHEVPGIEILGPTDPVGAGDTVVAAVATALAAGETAQSAATFANLCAAVTVRKLQTTGTATPAEVRAAAAAVQYVYCPDLADDARRTRRLEGTEFEVVRDLPRKLAIRHAIFDHDGTLSTLREGWEAIMQPMMVRAILGPHLNTAPKDEFDRINELARQFIDQTTGIQTLVQMQGLARLVREGGYVPAGEILDEHGYKRLYNDELLAMVRQRLAKLQRGELAPEDFQIKNAAPLLRHLHARGVKLYLASGTDEADVIAEAQAMGYADLFEGRICGAIGNANVEAKKLVLERIIREHRLAGHEFVTFGDGPVEMRETHQRGGIAIGLCSDEVRRLGWNPAKRRRLIRGGADVLIPDFSQLSHLLRLLQLD